MHTLTAGVNSSVKPTANSPHQTSAGSFCTMMTTRLLTYFCNSNDKFLQELYRRIMRRRHHRVVMELSSYDLIRIKKDEKIMKLIGLIEDSFSRHAFQKKNSESMWFRRERATGEEVSFC